MSSEESAGVTHPARGHKTFHFPLREPACPSQCGSSGRDGSPVAVLHLQLLIQQNAQHEEIQLGIVRADLT